MMLKLVRKPFNYSLKLGYDVIYKPHAPSGRPQLSKGLLDEAKSLAEKNVQIFHDEISDKTPLIGLEPSAILTFRDEYTTLTRGEVQEKAKRIAKHTYTIEEFLAKELKAGRIKTDSSPQSQKPSRYMVIATRRQFLQWYQLKRY